MPQRLNRSGEDQPGMRWLRRNESTWTVGLAWRRMTSPAFARPAERCLTHWRLRPATSAVAETDRVGAQPARFPARRASLAGLFHWE